MSRWNRWTVHLVRLDGLESHTIRMERGRLTAMVGVAVLLLLALGIVAGRYWASRLESADVARLQARVADLQDRNRQVNELAQRLATVEERYRQLRGAVTGSEVEPPSPVAVPVESAATGGESETATFAWPLSQRGFVTRTFGSLGDPTGGGHTGLDIAVPMGSYVRAIAAGRVAEVGEDSVYGRFVRIAHADGLTSLYGHNAWLFATRGDSVERLEVIALSGNTGRSTAPHLHLEMARGGSLLDPLDLVTEEGLRDEVVTEESGTDSR
jgi:murein DD-endopeptidase MepM/ murein hydrolase activator NlpD